MKYLKYFSITLLVIAIDQAVKMLVHFNMAFGLPGEIHIAGNWLKLHYTLNPGMAFGMQIGSEYGKLILTLFRLIAMGGIGWYLTQLVNKHAHTGLIICVAMILGGAIGNIIDSILYGVLLHNAPNGSPSPWFHGQVIDMFFVDLWEGIIPEWVPFMGGQWYSLWPIFNVADASIFCGITSILIFQKTFFKEFDVATV